MFSVVLLGSCGVEGCTDPLAVNYDADATKDDGSCEFIGIGDTMQGGIVFYLDGTGGGLIAATQDQPLATVWGTDTVLVGSNNSGINQGNQNTQEIVNVLDSAGIAADICHNLILNGYDDWFLPSIDELDILFNNIIGSFSYETLYWSSSELDTAFASCIIIQSGVQRTLANKMSLCKVRPIRTF